MASPSTGRHGSFLCTANGELLTTARVLYGQRGEQQDDVAHPLLLNTLKVNLA